MVEVYVACALAVEIEFSLNTSHFSKSKRESITQEALFIVLAEHSAVTAATIRVTRSFSLPLALLKLLSVVCAGEPGTEAILLLISPCYRYCSLM